MSHKCCIRNVLEPNHHPAKGRYCNALVEDSLNKILYFYDCDGNYVSWSQEGSTPGPTPEPEPFTVTLPVTDPVVDSYMVWTATKRSKAIRFLAKREGGIGATVNVLKNGQKLLTTDLSLSIEEAWLEGAPLLTDVFAPGDTLAFDITAVEGDVGLISFSMELEENV